MSDTNTQHPALSRINFGSNELRVAGKGVREIANELGSTPFYLYDREAMSARVKHLRQALPQDISLHYAIKANPMPAVVEHLAALVDGLDVASVAEMQVALNSGTDAKHISFAGPGKSDLELTRAVEAGVTVNLESPNELRRIGGIGKSLGKTPVVAIRVNPDFELKTSGMKMGGGPKPFGIDAEQVPEILARIRSMDVHFRGFHIFSGSQNLRPEAIIEAHTKTFALAQRLAEHAPEAIELLNIGGGFGIPYFPKDNDLDLAPIAENLRQLLPGVHSALPNAEIVIELGRYLVGEAGFYICEVIDKKVSRGHTYLVTNGGLHHHLAASGNFGQIIRKNYPAVIATNLNGNDKEQVSIVGPLCTPLDLLADNVELPKAEPGDLVAILQSGAYGYSASPLNFLSHPAPKEILL